MVDSIGPRPILPARRERPVVGEKSGREVARPPDDARRRRRDGHGEDAPRKGSIVDDQA